MFFIIIIIIILYCYYYYITIIVIIIIIIIINIIISSSNTSSSSFINCEGEESNHQIPQAKNIPYQPLLIKPVFNLLANAEKQVFFKTSLPVLLLEGPSFRLYSLVHSDVVIKSRDLLPDRPVADPCKIEDPPPRPCSVSVCAPSYRWLLSLLLWTSWGHCPEYHVSYLPNLERDALKMTNVTMHIWMNYQTWMMTRQGVNHGDKRIMLELNNFLFGYSRKFLG